MPEIVIDASPEKLELIDGVPTASLLNIPFLFKDKVHDLVKFETELEEKNPFE